MTDTRRCPAPDCDKPLERRIGESPGQYTKRTYCDRTCFAAALAARTPEEHGTVTGINQHRKNKTKLCDACREVQRTQTQNWRASNPHPVARERARYRAMKRVCAQHRADYLRFVHDEYRKAGVGV
jgi:hypothetical protein